MESTQSKLDMVLLYILLSPLQLQDMATLLQSILSITTNNKQQNIVYYLPLEGNSKIGSITCSCPCSFTLTTSNRALWPWSPFTPKRTLVVITCFLFFSLSFTKTAWFCSSSFLRSSTWSGSLPHSTSTSFTTGPPLGPPCPAAIPWVGWTHPFLLVTVNTWTVTCSLCYIIDWVLPNICRWTVVTH